MSIWNIWYKQIIQKLQQIKAKAKETAANGTTVNNGKGIDIGYIDNEDNYQYQVIRLYEE